MEDPFRLCSPWIFCVHNGEEAMHFSLIFVLITLLLNTHPDKVNRAFPPNSGFLLVVTTTCMQRLLQYVCAELFRTLAVYNLVERFDMSLEEHSNVWHLLTIFLPNWTMGAWGKMTPPNTLGRRQNHCNRAWECYIEAVCVGSWWAMNERSWIFGFSWLLMKHNMVI